MVKPEIHVLGLSIKTFGLFFALNFAAWGLLAARRLQELGRPVDWAYEMVTVALVGGLVGARAYYLVQNPDNLGVSDIFGGSGLIWYGGLAGGTLAVLSWARRHGFLSLDLLDLAGPGLALGYAIGRIGCQISGDGDYGKAWDGPWAMGYPNGTVPTAPGETVHPTPIYETLTMGLLAFALWQLRDKVRPGILFALYLVGAGAERFLVEFLRRNSDVAIGLTAAQFESLALLVLGAVWIAVALRRHGSIVLPEDQRRRRRAGRCQGRRRARQPDVSGVAADDEILDVFDEHGRLLGTKRRADVHRDGDWHLAFHLWVVAPAGVLLQRRARSKSSWPGFLDASAAGHLLAGETIRDGLREVDEELGAAYAFDDLVHLGVHRVAETERSGTVEP